MRGDRASESRWDLGILVGWSAVLAVVGAGRVTDTDPYWQARAGRAWLDGASLVHVDTWSWQPVEGLVHPNSPLWNAALAVGWSAGGSWGLFVLTAAAIGGYFALLAHLARALGAGRLATTAAVIAVGLAALPILSPRPALPATVLVLAGIAGAVAWSRRAATAPVVVSGALAGAGGLVLSAAGSWVHLSWSTTAMVVAAAWAAVWLLTPGLGPLRRTVLVLAGTTGLLVGVALGPYGLDAWARARAVVDASAGVIEEWSAPLSVDPGVLWLGLAVLGLGGVAASGWWCWRSWRSDTGGDPRLRVVAALAVAALPPAVVGLAFARFIPVTILLLGPLVALAVQGAASWLRRRARTWHRRDLVTAHVWRRVLSLVLVVVAPLAVLIAAPPATPPGWAATAVLPSGCRLFSAPDEAAWVILTRPDVPVWIDGRSDYWGRERLVLAQRYLAAMEDPPVPPGTTCVLLPSGPGGPRLAERLDSSPEWRRAAEDGAVAVWLPTTVRP